MSYQDNQKYKQQQRATQPQQTRPESTQEDPLAQVALTKEELDTKPDVEERKPEPGAAKASSPMAARACRVRVVEDGKVMLGACVHRFRKGDVLDGNHYMPAVFRQLLGSIKTEPVKD